METGTELKKIGKKPKSCKLSGNCCLPRLPCIYAANFRLYKDREAGLHLDYPTLRFVISSGGFFFTRPWCL